MNKPEFEGGINIALKVPKIHFQKTVEFYRDVLGFDVVEDLEQATPSYTCQFGPNRLWIDMVENYSQTDVWLEIKTPNLEKATEYLKQNNVPVRDELEPLPAGMKGHWISNPAGVVHLLIP